MSDAPNNKVLAVVIADLAGTAIGTRSRLGDTFAGRPVLQHVVSRLLQVTGVQEVAILAPARDIEQIHQLLGPEDRLRVLELTPRSESLSARVKIGRAWNLHAWRGGAGQWTTFDEEYHPAAIAHAAAELGADHVLAVHSHSIFLDVAITSALVHHHLHKNHEMRVTYTPAAPGLSGMLLRGDIVKEMGEKSAMPAHLLGYDPKAPAFDTLIREACMQVDPALSKIPNRFCVDTQRAWNLCATLHARGFESAADLCTAAAREVAPGVTDLSCTFDFPRELEIELTGRRATTSPGTVPAHIREARAELDAPHWTKWFSTQLAPELAPGLTAPPRNDFSESQNPCDDLLLTLAGDGDPLLYPNLLDILRAARPRALSICFQTDLATGDIDSLLTAAGENLLDVVTVTMYGHTAETYNHVSGSILHATVMKNMERLADVTRPRGTPLVIPRLLKTRDTLPEMEAFFDAWIERCGWAVIDAPTDRAGSIPFAAVVDMAPPKRRPCRRLWNRLLIRPDGTATACDQDTTNHLRVGNIESMTLQQMWQALNPPRTAHASGKWNNINPCKSCREWHRA